MSKQTTRVDSAKPTEQNPTAFLTGSILRIRPDAQLWPANVAAALMSLELESDPSMIHEMIDAELFPESCRVAIRPIDVYRMRQKWGARIGVSQRAAIRSKDVKIIDY